MNRKLAKAIRDKAKANREIELLTNKIATLSIARSIRQERRQQEEFGIGQEGRGRLEGFGDIGLAIGNRVRRTKAKSARERNLIGVVKDLKQEHLHAPKALCEFWDRSRNFWYFTDSLVRVTNNQQ